MGICNKCGREATLINGVCSECLAVEVHEKAKEDYKNDPCWTPGPIESGLVDEDSVDDTKSMQILEKTATATQEATVRLQMGIKSKMKDRDGAIKKIMSDMGLFSAADRATYKEAVENMYDKHKGNIDNGTYKVTRARLIDTSKVKVIDTDKGIVVYE